MFWKADAGTYRYGFNGQEKEDDIASGDLDFGARIYDSRLGRFLSMDPQTDNYPYLSPYVFAANNPIMLVDFNGESPAIPKDKFWMKFDKWRMKNQSQLLNLTKLQQMEMFQNSKTWYGKTVKETKWFQKYNDKTIISITTAKEVIVKSNEPYKKVEIKPDSKRGVGALSQVVDIGGSEGEVTINYDMRELPDRLQVINDATGKVLFDTKDVEGIVYAYEDPDAVVKGKVYDKDGSGQTIKFDLGKGNTKLRVVINENNKEAGGTSVFDYSLDVKVKTKDGYANEAVTDVQKSK